MSVPHAQSQSGNFKYNMSSQIANVQLSPVGKEISVFPPFVARQTETLILKEKLMSLSGDSFDICLANGQPLIRVQGKLGTISGRKKVYDVGGKYLFDIYKEHLHIHSTYAVEVEGQGKIMEVKSSFKLIGSKMTASFKSADGRSHSLTMSGNWLSTTADIIDESTGALVGRIDRKLFNAREIFGGQQTYALVVAPGVDMALMAALCICMDEKNNEK
ncbi:tubby C-terminal-like domain-containing protein [Plectosphaerella plurivora]|uniref:Tubby C-terminal-like domain-containing protein n=1 Tax=Plectosphaerella plurivora TaxID=936078 RepID=A0A9P8V9F9_9PEZI|nr:tubby C-terminal-like domain-containing protein [Plectosphaerella plurivora]